jgi:hypothetical protein
MNELAVFHQQKRHRRHFLQSQQTKKSTVEIEEKGTRKEDQDEVLIVAILRANRPEGAKRKNYKTMKSEWEKTWAKAAANQKTMSQSNDKLIAKDRAKREVQRRLNNDRTNRLTFNRKDNAKSNASAALK